MCRQQIESAAYNDIDRINSELNLIAQESASTAYGQKDTNHGIYRNQTGIDIRESASGRTHRPMLQAR